MKWDEDNPYIKAVYLEIYTLYLTAVSLEIIWMQQILFEVLIFLNSKFSRFPNNHECGND